MTFARIILGITILILILSGCGRSKAPPDPVGDETLHEVRFGSAVFDPEATNLIAYGKENRISFQFLKNISPKNVDDSFSMSLLVHNNTRGWSNIVSTFDVWNNGSISIVDNELGSIAYYNANHPLDVLLEPLSCDSFYEAYYIFPGDEVILDFKFFTFEYADQETFLLFSDTYRTCCASDIFSRPVGSDDIDSEGFIEGFRIGSYEISDEEINLIPLGDVFDITIDFNCQLNPYKFADLIDFRFVINNQYSNKSYTMGMDTMLENGSIYVVDYVQGVARFVMDHPMSYCFIDGQLVQTALPGDLVQIWIDFFEGEDSQENEFVFQNKKFRIFYLGTQLIGSE
jgi:hypothetical protein